MNPQHSLEMRRTVHASAADIYTEWTEPDRLSRWMGEVIEADVRPGGRYHVRFHDGDTAYDHSGAYLALEPESLVRMSFLAAAPDTVFDEPLPYKNEYIEVVLNPIDNDRTELVFINGWDGDAMDAEGIKQAKQAWGMWLDMMEESLK